MPPETHVSNRIAHPDFLIWNTAANGWRNYIMVQIDMYRIPILHRTDKT